MKGKMFSKPDAFSKIIPSLKKKLFCCSFNYIMSHSWQSTWREERKRTKEEERSKRSKKEVREVIRSKRDIVGNCLWPSKNILRKATWPFQSYKNFVSFFFPFILSFSFLGEKRNQIKPTKISFSHLLSLFGVSLERERTKRRRRKTNEMKCNLESNRYLFNYTLDLIAIFTICET